MKKLILAAAVAGAVLLSSAAQAQTTPEGYQLQQVLMMSRHNLRAPLANNGSVLEQSTPNQWSESAPAVVITVLNFVLIIPHLSGVNRNYIAVISHTTGKQVAGNVPGNVQTNKVAACRFGISNQPFHFLIHCLCDAAFQYTNIKPEGAGRVTVFPPLRHVDEIAERLHHTPDCTYCAFMTVDEIGIADNGAFCRFRPLFIPPVDRKRPRQPRQQICRTGIRVPQLTNNSSIGMECTGISSSLTSLNSCR